jgi:hypothetical protein
MSIGQLKRMEREGVYANIDKIPKAFDTVGRRTEVEGSAMPAVMGLPSRPEQTDLREFSKDFPLIDVVYADIIPADHKITNATSPEKWIFAVANEQVVIQCERLGAHHDEFPILACEYSPDQHVAANPGLVELTMPLEYILSWLFNSHIENVRKTINDMIVFDPGRIVEQDLRQPGPGRLIRLLPEAAGTPISQAIMQLRVQDITQGHLKDSEVVLDLLQRVTAITDSLLGLPIVGGRRTATEVRGARENATTRLKTTADITSALFMTRWTKQMVANNQQYLDEPLYVRIQGGAPPARFLEINPQDILGQYDFPIGDMALPVDKQDMADNWKDILQVCAGNEILSQEVDLFRVLTEAVKYLGVLNMEEFRRTVPPGMPQGMDPNMAALMQAAGLVPGVSPSVQPDEQVEKGVKAGNLVPVEQGSANPVAAALAGQMGHMMNAGAARNGTPV